MIALVWNLGVPANLLMVLSKYESGQLDIVLPVANPIVALSAFNHCCNPADTPPGIAKLAATVKYCPLAKSTLAL